MMVDKLLDFASSLEGDQLKTAGGRATFTLRVVPRGIEVTPASSGKPRLVSREMIQLVLDEYERSRNLTPGQYQAITFDASYLLVVIARYIHEAPPS
jgi:hypothetical protein